MSFSTKNLKEIETIPESSNQESEITELQIVLIEVLLDADRHVLTQGIY